MKNSAHYAKKIRRIVKDRAGSISAVEPTDTIELIVRGILEEDVDPRKVPAALSAIKEEYVDFNELRVSPVRDIIDVVGEDYPHIRSKAQSIVNALQTVFDQSNALSLDFLTGKPKREIRKMLREKIGLGRYAGSFVTLYGFDGHAMPVDNLLLEALKIGGHVHPDSDLDDLQGFLERITPHVEAIVYHQALRKYVSEMARRVMRLRARQLKEAQAVESQVAAPAGVGKSVNKAEATRKDEKKVVAVRKEKKKKSQPDSKRKRKVSRKTSKSGKRGKVSGTKRSKSKPAKKSSRAAGKAKVSRSGKSAGKAKSRGV